MVLIGILYLPTNSLFETKKASALFGVGDVSFSWETNPAALTDIPAKTLTLTQLAIKIGGQVLKKVLLDRMVDALITWISSGDLSDGGTLMEDWGAIWDNAGDYAIGELAKSVGAGILCSPFKLQLQTLMVPPKTFTRTLDCSLTSIQGNIQNFFDDFKNGGWISYQEMWMPQNNFYGAAIMAADQYAIKKAEKAEAVKSEAVAGGGFLSMKKCDTNGQNCRIITPGSFIGQAVGKATIDTPFDTIVGADDIAGYVTAIADAFINRLTSEGITGLSRIVSGQSNKQDHPEDYQEYWNNPSDPCANQTGSALNACLEFQELSDIGNDDTKSDYLSQIKVSLDPRRDADNVWLSIIASQQELVTALFALAQCQSDSLDTEMGTQAPITINQAIAEETILTTLKTQSNNNSQILAQLQVAYNYINGPSANAAEMLIKFNDVKYLLDADAANAALATANENLPLIASNQSKITDANTNLISCQNINN